MNSNTYSTVYVVVAALHESINPECNIYNNIAEGMSLRKESRLSRRLVKKAHEVLSKLKRQAARVSMICRIKATKCKTMKESEVELVCMGLHDSMNRAENIFQDIVEAIYERHIDKMIHRQHGDEKEKNSSPPGEKHIKKKKRCIINVFGAAKRLFSCSEGTNIEEAEG